ncbi:MAG: glycosyltransferase [Thermoanaerobaculaceae bacterium]
MIPVHNCAHFLEKALKSVLSQAPEPERMQIAVVDDASVDNPEEVVQRLGGSRVEFFRHQQPQGGPGNFNTCLRLARGFWVHILHGDDAVRPGFYERFEGIITKVPDLAAVFCRVIFIDENDHWLGVSDLDLQEPQIYPNLFSRLVVSDRIWAQSIVVARTVYEQVGGFRPELPHCADWDMWKRAAQRGPVWFEPEPLVYYRRHTHSDTAKLARDAKNIADMRKAVAISASYLTAEQKPLLGLARKKVSEIALAEARELLEKRRFGSAFAHIREAVKAWPSPITLANVAFLLLAFVLRRLVPAQHKL